MCNYWVNLINDLDSYYALFIFLVNMLGLKDEKGVISSPEPGTKDTNGPENPKLFKHFF